MASERRRVVRVWRTYVSLPTRRRGVTSVYDRRRGTALSEDGYDDIVIYAEPRREHRVARIQEQWYPTFRGDGVWQGKGGPATSSGRGGRERSMDEEGGGGGFLGADGSFISVEDGAGRHRAKVCGFALRRFFGRRGLGLGFTSRFRVCDAAR